MPCGVLFFERFNSNPVKLVSINCFVNNGAPSSKMEKGNISKMFTYQALANKCTIVAAENNKNLNKAGGRCSTSKLPNPAPLKGKKKGNKDTTVQLLSRWGYRL